MKRAVDSPDIIVLPPVLLAGTVAIGMLIHYALWKVALVPEWFALVAGLILFAAAGVLAYLAEQAMERLGTNVFPTQPTLALATSGPYRFTRNPLYIAALAMYLAMTLWVNSLVLLLLLFPMALILHWGVVLREEVYLTRKFGAAYLEYQSRVRRWI